MKLRLPIEKKNGLVRPKDNFDPFLIGSNYNTSLSKERHSPTHKLNKNLVSFVYDLLSRFW